jgi:hypothetical protein
MSDGDFDRKQIIINSQFREAGSTSTTDFTWRFKERIEGVRHAELRYFVFENGAYNITSGSNGNNTFLLTEYTDALGTTASFTNQTVSIPVGAYDDTSLIQAIGLAMTSTSTTHTTAPTQPVLYFLSFDATGILSITCSFNRSFMITFDTTDPVQVRCAGVLGFTATATGSEPTNQKSWLSGQAFTVYGVSAQQLTNYDYLLVKSQKLGNDISFWSATGVTDQSAVIPEFYPNTPTAPPFKSPASCFAFVPNTVANSGNTYSIIYELQRPPQIANLKHPYSLDYVDIQICDKYGAVIDAYTNNITIGLELFLDKKSEPRSTAERSGGAGGGCGCRGCYGC